MTALSALRSTTVRRDISRATHAHDETVKAFLRGFPTGRDDDLRVAALAAGVDLGTIPVLPSAVIAKRKEARTPKCKRCRELEAQSEAADLLADARKLRLEIAERRVAELEAQLEKARAHNLEQMRDWKAQWTKVCEERDELRESTNIDVRIRELLDRGVRLAPIDRKKLSASEVEEVVEALGIEEGKQTGAYPPGTVAAIDAQDAEARRPRPPAELVAALQDSPHRELGPSRPVVAIRREPKPKAPVVTLVGFPDDEPAVAT